MYCQQVSSNQDDLSIKKKKKKVIYSFVDFSMQTKNLFSECNYNV